MQEFAGVPDTSLLEERRGLKFKIARAPIPWVVRDDIRRLAGIEYELRKRGLDRWLNEANDEKHKEGVVWVV